MESDDSSQTVLCRSQLGNPGIEDPGLRTALGASLMMKDGYSENACLSCGILSREVQRTQWRDLFGLRGGVLKSFLVAVAW
jgi:hypothetical protein